MALLKLWFHNSLLQKSTVIFDFFKFKFPFMKFIYTLFSIGLFVTFSCTRKNAALNSTNQQIMWKNTTSMIAQRDADTILLASPIQYKIKHAKVDAPNTNSPKNTIILSDEQNAATTATPTIESFKKNVSKQNKVTSKKLKLTFGPVAIGVLLLAIFFIVIFGSEIKSVEKGPWGC